MLWLPDHEAGATDFGNNRRLQPQAGESSRMLWSELSGSLEGSLRTEWRDEQCELEKHGQYQLARSQTNRTSLGFGLETIHVIPAKSLAAFCPRPEVEFKNSASFVWQRKCQDNIMSRLWCGYCAPHFPDRQWEWAVDHKDGKMCSLLKNPVNLDKAADRNVRFSVGVGTWTQFKLKTRQVKIKHISTIKEKLWMLRGDDTKVA